MSDINRLRGALRGAFCFDCAYEHTLCNCKQAMGKYRWYSTDAHYQLTRRLQGGRVGSPGIRPMAPFKRHLTTGSYVDLAARTTETVHLRFVRCHLSPMEFQVGAMQA
jgi:hypothetical protein